jgi:hypothetical protein
MGREEWEDGKGGVGGWVGRSGRMGKEEWEDGYGGVVGWEGRSSRMGREEERVVRETG